MLHCWEPVQTCRRGPIMIADLTHARAILVMLCCVAAPGLGAAADPDLRLITAAADQDKATLRSLIRQGVDVNTARADGATALLYAAHHDDLEGVDLLLKAGANVNAAEDHGVTPLARA